MAELHPATSKLVDDFSVALKIKLLEAQERYGWEDGWLDENWREQCTASLKKHIKKGDPRDVAIYCMFMWYHGWTTIGELKDGGASMERVAWGWPIRAGWDRQVPACGHNIGEKDV